VAIYTNKTPTTNSEFTNATAVASALSQDRTSPFTLKNYFGSAFTQTGSFLVVLSVYDTLDATIASSTYFKGDVSFNNGSATVDFDSMTSITSLH
jgi:hypothetical protein